MDMPWYSGVKKMLKTIQNTLNNKIGESTDAAGVETLFGNQKEILRILNESGGDDSELLFVINGLLSDQKNLRDWAFRQPSIGRAINDAFELGSDALASCTSVEAIAANSTAIAAIGGSDDAINACKYNSVLLPSLINYVDDAELILAAGLGYKKYAVGDTVTINYNGVGTVFRVAHKNYKTTNKIVLVSEGILDMQSWADSANNYSTSRLREYLNSTVLRGFSDEIQNAIVATNVACHNKSTAVTCTDKVWALSFAEVGLGTNTYAPAEGSALSYFNSASRRVKYMNGTATVWWLRTPYTYIDTSAWGVGTNGSSDLDSVTDVYGVVPAFEI